MLNIVQNRKIYFMFSGALVALSVIFLMVFGLKPGIDFTGGSLMEISFSQERPAIEEMREVFADNTYGNVLVQSAGDTGYLFKMRFLTEDEHQTVLEDLRAKFEVLGEESDENVGFTIEGDSEMSVKDLVIDTADTDAVTSTELAVVTENRLLEERFETIGPAVSAHLKERSTKAAIAVLIAIVAYIAYAFRKVSKPIKSWKYGVTAVIALFHDVLITMGVFALLGRYAGVEIDIPFVVALITILGYSVNDTIVVFDRVRENLIRQGYDDFEGVVNRGVNETLMRSLNASVTTLLVLVALYAFGGASIHYFALALIIGIGFGTYSSIFLASPLLVVWQK
jgi:preprotein translocase subunit SecF